MSKTPANPVEEKWRDILDLIAQGFSIASICKRKDMPGSVAIYNYIRDSAERQREYEQSRIWGFETKIDQIQDIANEDIFSGDSISEILESAKIANARVQDKRLRIDTLKWEASKLLPRKYGASIDLNHGGQDGNPIINRIERVIIDSAGIENISEKNHD